MSFRKIYNLISTTYHSFSTTYNYTFNDPNLINLIDKIDKINVKDTIQLIIYNHLNNIIIFDSYNISNIEEKSHIEFCNIIKDIILDILNKDSDKNNYLSIFNNDIFSNNILKYNLIGFLFEKYIDKYNLIIQKLKNIETEKKDIYIILIKDFMLEYMTNISLSLYKDIITLVENNINIYDNLNIDLKNNNSHELIININKLIDDNTLLLKIHNEKIKTLL
jgi:hypothetical protein